VAAAAAAAIATAEAKLRIRKKAATAAPAKEMERWTFCCMILCCIWRSATGGGKVPTCTPASLTSSSPAKQIVDCGAVLMQGVLPSDILGELLDAFRLLPPATTQSLRHGAIRDKREQTHLPFEQPFDRVPLLGPNLQLKPVIIAALGKEFVLDLATIVAASEDAVAQSAHRDTPLAGSVAAHIPLEPLSAESAPLGFCIGTHTMPSEQAKSIMRESLLWRPKGESAEDAQRRLYCGGGQPTETLQLDVKGKLQAGIRLRDSRLSAKIVRFTTQEAEALPWQVGDEITHCGGKRIAMSEDVMEALEAATSSAVTVQLERPIGHPPEFPPRLTVGAPLAVGDVLLYDSRTWHWGMANRANRTRYVLYVNFKSSNEHGGVHPEASGTEALRAARAGFQQMFVQLCDAGHGTTNSEDAEL